MIVLIVGDFGVGKDTVADLLLSQSLTHKSNSYSFQKILSYATRKPRYEGEDTHIFTSKEEFLKFDDLVACTKIDDNYYGARFSQFDTEKINLYCVDDKGVSDIIDKNIDDVFIVEVIRPKWLRNVSNMRLARKRESGSFKYNPDYIILNDKDLFNLEISVSDCFNAILKYSEEL